MIETEHLKGAGVSHGFFTRGGGHSTGIFASLNCGLGSGDDPDLVMKNRETVTRQLGASTLVSAWQVHSADVATVTEAWPVDQRPKADAMVTNTKGLAIGVLTADCAPVLFLDREARVIGAAHSGWKGALHGVALNTITAMEALGAERGRMTTVIGPTISKANYEVGPEFAAPFLARDAEARKFFTPSVRDGHHMFDLPGFLQRQMKLAGVGTVINLDLCTYADEAKFFSYRRATHRGETDYGRLISALALV
jgi:polyphenol oxidase